jgi:hypothetical protein
MRPQPASSMPGSTAAVSAAGAMTLSSKARRTSATGMAAVGPSGSTVAALLTRMSTRPAASAVVAARPRCCASLRSAGMTRICPAAVPRPTRISAAPASASPSATARPIPRPAHVISAVLPARSVTTVVSFRARNPWPVSSPAVPGPTSGLRRDALLVSLDVTGRTSAGCQAALSLAPLWRTVLPRDLRQRLEWPARSAQAGNERAVSYQPAAPSGGLMKKIARLLADDHDTDRRHRPGGPLDRSPPGLQNPRRTRRDSHRARRSWLAALQRGS